MTLEFEEDGTVYQKGGYIADREMTYEISENEICFTYEHSADTILSLSSVCFQYEFMNDDEMLMLYGPTNFFTGALVGFGERLFERVNE